MLLSETGPFSIPVRCRTKKCQVKLEHTHLDFDRVFVGEVVRRQLTIYNTGALPTNYTVSRSHAGREPSLVVKSEKSDEPEAVSGKLAEKSDTSVKSDFGMYGRSVEEMVQLGSVSVEYSTKSKSMGNMGLHSMDSATTPIIEEQADHLDSIGIYIYLYLASEQSKQDTHWQCQIKICDIYMCVYPYVG